MDPNATLEIIRSARQDVRSAIEGDGDIVDAAERLADAAEALDEWLSRGGFLPGAWQEGRAL